MSAAPFMVYTGTNYPLLFPGIRLMLAKLIGMEPSSVVYIRQNLKLPAQLAKAWALDVIIHCSLINPSSAHTLLRHERHELGHSIIWIGDEYDGSIYFGPNAAELAHNKSISWAHWLSEPTGSDAPPRAERNAVPLLAYPWTMLNTTKAWSTTFTSDGTFSYVLLRFSLSAVPDAKALEIKLDGETISWEAKPGVGLDRWFYDVWVNEKKSGLRNGTHELSFALQEGGKEGLAQLCSVEVVEYGNKNEFNLTEGFVGAFPT
ncbi:hypothetical protein FRC12_021181 [Ceratobasidium sp. 428]|nr:hypothetical protein FRC12_021181 [Ceratobasidium sp. 428]